MKTKEDPVTDKCIFRDNVFFTEKRLLLIKTANE